MRRNRKRNPASLRETHKRAKDTEIINENIKEQNNKATKKKKKKKEKKPKTIIKRIIYVILILIFLGLLACAGIGAGMYAAIVGEINDMNMQGLTFAQSSIVYYTDENGNSFELDTVSGDGSSIWVESGEISNIMKEPIISIEDERFYAHNGVDFKRSTGAIMGWIREQFGGSAVNYGGSTITQQVVKNITQEKDRTATRKIKEMMRAVAIEKQLSKDEILTIYLNVIYLANNCYGVEAASQMYFGKSASALDLREAALIAGITQRPSFYDPLKNPENAKEKRNTVLAKMHELGKISDQEYNEAVASDLGLAGKHQHVQGKVYSYFIDAVISDVVNDLQIEKGYTKAFATQQLYSGGLKIYTTLDVDIQNIMEDIYEDEDHFPGAEKDVQSAMVIIDPKNGEIKGMVGGKGKKTESRGLNRATQTTRQPGSSIKPLSVYAPAVDQGIITPSTTVVDEPITIRGWSPVNSYSGYKGGMSVKKAVEISANIPAIKVLQKLGTATSYDYVTNKFHLSTIIPKDKDLSPLALGGLTNGVSVKEMAAAYTVFANNGLYTRPHTYTKVVDGRGRVILENTPTPEQAIEESTAHVMSELLKGVVTGSSGTGKSARLENMTAYGKTGTTNNNYDKWFVGYTPYYVGAVWFGFDTPTNLRSAGISGNPSAKIWKLVMDEVHMNLENKELESSEDMVSVWICDESGLLADSDCESTRKYFKKGTQPKKYCSLKHKKSSTTTVKPQKPKTSKSPTRTIEPEMPIITNTATPKPVATQTPAETTAPTSAPTSVPSQTAKPVETPVSTKAPESTQAPKTEAPSTPKPEPKPTATPKPTTNVSRPPANPTKAPTSDDTITLD